MPPPPSRAPAMPPALAETLLAFVNRSRTLVQAEETAHHGCGGLLAAMLGHLDDLGRRLSESPPATRDASSTTWGPIRLRRHGDDRLGLEISGPAEGEVFSFVAGSQDDARRVERLVRDLDRLSAALARGEAQIARACRLGEGGNAARSVVREHIGLLQSYNEIRDVGQQLIGVIAENRGVSLGAIYRDNEFGVGHND